VSHRAASLTIVDVEEHAGYVFRIVQTPAEDSACRLAALALLDELLTSPKTQQLPNTVRAALPALLALREAFAEASGDELEGDVALAIGRLVAATAEQNASHFLAAPTAEDFANTQALLELLLDITDMPGVCVPAVPACLPACLLACLPACLPAP